ncbi:DNA cytosine methyltransferase [Haloarcula sp. CBA1131]|uniref:DNA cytosine methyltransferase n=1 Tax=Haloarcula sp. CBA1131 TaxID=1853686 RepID=UPI0012489A61|nr:DNA cytosine methyltransferase [Haloarcula sp. CBA1131]KAA9400770.1 DNA cytosine methyltransferase [Haloarcula sp. CBA1131]KAA9404132.1 DNA cytosine methyltransferase [Haloarcula sp. CBA1131]
MHISAIDLFCGAGGLTNGLERAGISVEAGIDIDPDCEYPYGQNNDAEFLLEDIGELARDEPERVAEYFDTEADATLLAGCAPCQPFSPLTHGSDSSEHSKYGMLEAFLELVKEIDPDFVVMENVFEVRHADVYNEFIEELDELGYNLNPENDRRVYCPEYDIPQTRRRWVVLASKGGCMDLGAPLNPNPKSYPTVKDRIGHLEPLKAGETSESDPLHSARELSETNLKRIRNSEPGGSWQDWPEELILECHKKVSGQSYESVYGRMVADEPAPTITTQFYNLGSGRFGHYDTDQDRALSLREGAMLQTFPEDYSFAEDPEEVGITKIGRLIGNAVPPKLGEVIGDRVGEFLTGIDKQAMISEY